MRILGFDDVLGRLKAKGNWLISENDVGRAQLSGLVKEDLRLEYSIKIPSID